MRESYLFTSESVSEGHPDKVSDRISDEIVDLFYRAPRIITADEKTILDAHDAGGSVERTQVGGLVLNHLGWARVLGLSAGIFGKMGDDRHGEFLRAGVDRFGPELGLPLLLGPRRHVHALRPAVGRLHRRGPRLA